MKARICLALPLLLALLSGCGGAPNSPSMMTGKVTYNNNPVTGGTVEFAPEKEGPAYRGVIAADGAYTVQDVPPGDYVVTIETESLNPDRPKPTYGPPGQQGAAPAGSSMPGGAAPAGPVGKYMKIDPKYKDPKTSGLTAKVNPGGGKQTKDFPLTGS